MSKCTTACVICYGPVKWLSGHVIVQGTDEVIAAGLCLTHGNTREAAACPDFLGRAGCFSYWVPAMGAAPYPSEVEALEP